MSSFHVSASVYYTLVTLVTWVWSNVTGQVGWVFGCSFQVQHCKFYFMFIDYNQNVVYFSLMTNLLAN